MLNIKKQTIGKEEVQMIDITPVMPTRTIRADIHLSNLKKEEVKLVEQIASLQNTLDGLNAKIGELESAGIKEIVITKKTPTSL